MVLSEWLEQQPRGTRTKLAEAVGVKPSHITGICNGSSLPSLRVAQAIERFTGGAVTAADYAAAA